MTLALRYAARSDVGLIRTNNEDAVYAGPRLLAVADGATVSAAARRLDISPQTLATHLRDAYTTLGVTGRIAALNLLREHDLLRAPSPGPVDVRPAVGA